MSTTKDLKAKVINTLNILSGQDITETKLYKSILTASDKDKENIVIMSRIVSETFWKIGRSLQTMKIFKWLKIIFDELEIIENNVDFKKYMYIKKILSNTRRTLSLEEIADRVKNIYFLAYDYADAWVKYLINDESDQEKIVKNIQPLELFILTAITVLPIACQISQKSFENFVNMDFKTLVNVLCNDYIPLVKFAYNSFSDSDKEIIDHNIFDQYRIFNRLVNEKESGNENSEEILNYVLNSQDIDKMFGKIIKVSKKSEYEKLKSLYKK